MTLEKKKKIVMNPFFNAQFNYCPFIWMLHGRKNNNKIKHLHERCLRLIYSDKKSSYENLLEKDNSVSIHHKNIQELAIEMFKVKRKLCSEITGDIFTGRTNNQYNLRNRPDFITPHVHSAFHGPESISYLGPKISLNSFKESIKMWVPTNCPCRLCKVYLDGVGFINRIIFFIYVYSWDSLHARLNSHYKAWSYKKKKHKKIKAYRKSL